VTWTILPILLALATAATTPPAGPTGQFVVVHAPRHPTVSNMQAAYRPDDPRLINRIVTLQGATATFDGGAKDCGSAARTTSGIASGQLVRQIFPDRPNYGKTTSRPVDFGLRLAPVTLVTVTRFRCSQPHGNHGPDWNGAALFPLSEGRWALSLIKDHLLILQPAAGPIRASFDRAKAGSVAERTICSDRLLAGWDRSVAEACR